MNVTLTWHLVAAVIVAFFSQAQRFQPVATGQILEALHVKQGSTVCEIGAGEGELTLSIAAVVGPNGQVYASELGVARLDALRKRVATNQTVVVVESAETSTNFRDESCDAIVLKDVYHHLSDPASIDKSILRALKTHGRVVVVDFTPPGNEAPTPAQRGIDGMHGVLPATVERELTAAGFERTSTDAPPDRRWFVVIMSKPGTGPVTAGG